MKTGSAFESADGEEPHAVACLGAGGEFVAAGLNDQPDGMGPSPVWVITECYDPYQGPSHSDRAIHGLNLGPEWEPRDSVIDIDKSIRSPCSLAVADS